MIFGIAIFLIVILYLVENNRGRQAVKITVVLAVLYILVIGGFIGWEKYAAFQREKQTKSEGRVPGH